MIGAVKNATWFIDRLGYRAAMPKALTERAYNHVFPPMCRNLIALAFSVGYADSSPKGSAEGRGALYRFVYGGTPRSACPTGAVQRVSLWKRRAAPSPVVCTSEIRITTHLSRCRLTGVAMSIRCEKRKNADFTECGTPEGVPHCKYQDVKILSAATS